MCCFTLLVGGDDYGAFPDAQENNALDTWICDLRRIAPAELASAVERRDQPRSPAFRVNDTVAMQRFAQDLRLGKL